MKWVFGLTLVFIIFIAGRFIVDLFEIVNESYIFTLGYFVGNACLFINLFITNGLKS